MKRTLLVVILIVQCVLAHAVPQAAYCPKDRKLARWTGAYKALGSQTVCEYRHEDGKDRVTVRERDRHDPYSDAVAKEVKIPHAFWLPCQAPTPSDSYHSEHPSVYIESMPYDFGRLLALEFQRQKADLTIVSSPDKADYKLRGGPSCWSVGTPHGPGQECAVVLVSMSRIGVNKIGGTTGEFSINGRQTKNLLLDSMNPSAIAIGAKEAVEQMLTWDWSDIHPWQ